MCHLGQLDQPAGCYHCVAVEQDRVSLALGETAVARDHKPRVPLIAQNPHSRVRPRDSRECCGHVWLGRGVIDDDQRPERRPAVGQHASDTAHRHVRVAIDRNDDVGPGSLGHEPFPVESAQGVAVSRDDVPIQNTHVERTRPRNILLKCPDEQDEPGWNRTGMDRTRTVCLSPPPSWGNAHAPSQTTVLGIANLVSRFRRRPTAGFRGGLGRSTASRRSVAGGSRPGSGAGTARHDAA